MDGCIESLLKGSISAHEAEGKDWGTGSYEESSGVGGVGFEGGTVPLSLRFPRRGRQRRHYKDLQHEHIDAQPPPVDPSTTGRSRHLSPSP